MTPAWLLRHAINPAIELLPGKMQDPLCRPILLAIALQESLQLEHRRQIGGPALGFWQYEEIGVRGVMQDERTYQHARAALVELSYPSWHWSAELIHKALEHNDVLAAVFARLTLWQVPRSLPGPDDAEEAWRQYIAGWRPGKPHRGTWDAFYAKAWASG